MLVDFFSFLFSVYYPISFDQVQGSFQCYIFFIVCALN